MLTVNANADSVSPNLTSPEVTMRALLVEDDHERAAAFTLALKARNVVVDVADDVDEAVSLATLYDYDVMVISIPAALHRLCVTRVKAGRIVLTAHEAIADIVRHLGTGADDVMTHPVMFEELFARMAAIVRRVRGFAVSVIECGELVVNIDSRTITVCGRSVHLTNKEYQMVELLALRMGMTISKEGFLSHVYGGRDEPELKIIDVFLCKIRKKFRNAGASTDIIETVWGRGYTIPRGLPHVESPSLVPGDLPIVDSPPLAANVNDMVVS